MLVPITIFTTLYMTALWAWGLRQRNAGWVDFGWPSSFAAIALAYALTTEGFWLRTWLLAGMYMICGLRFMIGWSMRTSRHGEDHRWPMWRQRWQDGNGLFGIRPVGINLFAFYQTQALANIFILSLPLAIASVNPRRSLSPLEIVAMSLWLVSFALENIADTQLANFKLDRGNRGRVCKVGLWKYSRHPNYFFEWLVWVSYALFAWASVEQNWQYPALISVPMMAYWFLVYFTGIPMTEAASVLRRGAEYIQYQRETNRFFPGWPHP